jgi:ATP-dependent helicase/nuclease subunit B
MALKLICGPAGSGKTERAVDLFLATIERGESPLFIAPSGPDVRHFRREIIRRAGIVVGGEVTTFGNIARDILKKTGTSLRVIEAVERTMLLRAVVDSTENLAFLKPSSVYPGFIESISQLFSELQSSCLAPGQMANAARDILATDLNNDLFRIYENYRVALADQEATDLELAQCQALESIRGEPELLGHTTVIIDGFQDFTTIEHSLIATLIEAAEEVLLTAPFEEGRSVFDPVGRNFETYLASADCEQLSPPAAGSRPEALVHLDRNLFEDGAGKVEGGGAVGIIKGAGARGEAEMVAAEIARLIHDGKSLDDITIVCRSLAREAEAVAAALDDFGIPSEMNAPLRLADMPLGRALISLLDFILARADGDPGGQEADTALLGYLGSSLPVAEARQVDEYARTVKLHALSRPVDLIDAWGRTGGRKLDEISLLEEAAAAGIGPLSEKMSEIARRLVAAAIARSDSLGINDPASCEQDLLALQVLESACTEAEFFQHLEISGRDALEVLRGGLANAVHIQSSGRLRNSVRILDPHRVLNQRFDIVFLCGLVEGIFPYPGREDPFISDADRVKLAGRGIKLDIKANQFDQERFLFYRALTRARDKVYLSYPYCDSEGKENVPSLFIDEVLDLVDVGADQELVRTISEVAFSPGRAPVRKQALRSLCLAADLRGPHGEDPPAALVKKLTQAARPAGLDGAVMDCIAAAKPVEPGIDSPEVRTIFEDMTRFSASQLESYARCRFGYFTEVFLDPAPMELANYFMERGIIAHDILARFVKETKSHIAIQEADRDQLQVLHEKMMQVVDEELERHDVGRDVAAELLRYSLKHYMRRFVEQESEGGSNLVPDSLELSFGSGKSPYGAVNLGEGLTLSGRIDRIDREPESDKALVIDYKTSTKVSTWNKYEENQLVQIPLYVLAAECGFTPVGGEYYSVATGDRRGFYLEGSDELVGPGKKDNDFVSREQFDEIISSARERALVLAQGIRRMDFTAEPLSTRNCVRCGLLAVCRRRQSGVASWGR